MSLEDLKQQHLQRLTSKFGASEAKTLLRFLLEDFQIRYTDVKPEDRQILDNAIESLMNDMPIQYVTGKAHFYGIILHVNSNVLIPRPETEELVELLLKSHQNVSPLRVLDIGTGSGCIPIVIKQKWPKAQVTACDISPEALDVAIANARMHQVDINFVLCDFLKVAEQEQKLSGKWDIIISNPPYIPYSELHKMGKNVVDFEPHSALFTDDSEGLTFYKAIAQYAKGNLFNNGVVFLEMNEFHADKIENLFSSIGMITRMIHDLSGKPRMLQVHNHSLD